MTLPRPDGSVDVHFDEFDMAMVLMHASRIHAAKKANFISDRKNQVDRSSFDLDVIGSMGEYAVAKKFKLRMDRTIRKFGDDGNDLRFEQVTIQVKTSTNATGNRHLIFNSREDFKSSHAIAARVITPTVVTLLGWCSRDQFVESCVDKDFGYGPRVAVEIGWLNTMESFSVELHGF